MASRNSPPTKSTTNARWSASPSRPSAISPAQPPRGWLRPGLTETWETPEILVENGIEYVCDWVADDQPFEMRTAAGPLASVPYSVELNDIPMMLVQHHPAVELFNRVRDQFDRMYQEGADSARILTLAVHPYVSGVPHRIRYFEQALDYMAGHEDVLFWRGDQVLDWFRAQQAQ
jgi:allantoinase